MCLIIPNLCFFFLISTLCSKWQICLEMILYKQQFVVAMKFNVLNFLCIHFNLFIVVEIARKGGGFCGNVCKTVKRQGKKSWNFESERLMMWRIWTINKPWVLKHMTHEIKWKWYENVNFGEVLIKLTVINMLQARFSCPKLFGFLLHIVSLNMYCNCHF